MRIIVAGAGLTGTSIVSYLSKNFKADDIVVIDNNQKALKRLSQLYDIQTIFGSSSSPEILKQAGAKNADILMALTNSDEVNMVTCQMAYSLFNVPQKIARIESLDFLSPVSKSLYNVENMPIDYTISTDLAIANSIFSLIKTPFAKDVGDIKQGKIKMFSFKIDHQTPVIGAQIMELERLFENIKISPLSIIRGQAVIIPTQEETLKFGDEFLFLTLDEDADIAIKALGKESQTNEHVLIFGANKTSEILIEMLEKDSVITRVKLLEEDIKKAQDISYKYGNIQVISGSVLNDDVLSEASIEDADVTIALTPQDKDNILVSILSNSYNVDANISVLSSTVYDSVLDNQIKNTAVDKSAVIVSEIIKSIRPTNLDFAHVLSKDYGEVWGLKLTKRVDYKKIIKQKGINIAMIIRGDEIFYDIPQNGLYQKDYVILFAQNEHIKKIEELFL